ncbi:MAG: polysaccharide deacetylase family protein [Firmicutes bacterium]|nr:polysaccharide deacetylase family protein [Bacillota bacterium]
MNLVKTLATKYFILLLSFVLVVSTLLVAMIFSSTLQSVPRKSFAFKSQNLEVQEEIRLPIIMYHNILNSRKGKYVVSEQQLEDDFSAFLKHGFTPVFMSDVIDWVDGKTTLPTKPIVITFDDGHYNNIHYGIPIAKRLGVKFMINPVTSFSEFTVRSEDHSNPNYSHITWDQMREAHESGIVEFGNHTHRMHKFKPRFGIMRQGGESDATYTKTLTEDINESQDNFTRAGVPVPQTFAYPFGKYSKESKQILLDLGFRALLTCDEWINTVRKGDETSLHKLGRFNRDGHLSTAEIINRLENGKVKT